MAENKIVIDGIAGVNGEWAVDLDYFTNRELHTVKRMTGLRVGEYEDAMKSGDADLLVAFAVIALQRNGRQFDEDALWDAQAGSITFIVGDQEEEPLPPVDAPPQNGSSGNGGASDGSSGVGLTNGSDIQESYQSPTGTPV